MKKGLSIFLTILLLAMVGYYIYKNLKPEEKIDQNIVALQNHSNKIKQTIQQLDINFDKTLIDNNWIENNVESDIVCDEVYYSTDNQVLLYGCDINTKKYYFYDNKIYEQNDSEYQNFYNTIKSQQPQIEKGTLLKELATIDLEANIEEIDSCVDTGVCEVGTVFAIQVNDTDVYKFYVLADDSEKVDLIMAQNIINSSMWAPSDNLEGPSEAIVKLKEMTDNWTNLPLRSYKIADDNTKKVYSDIYNPMHATLPSYTDIAKVVKDNKIPSWLLENIDSSKTGGYWLSSASSSMSFYAWAIENRKIDVSDVSNENLGIRPVITLYKY